MAKVSTLSELKAKAVEKRILRQDQADAMPREKALELIFAAGLSTAQVISDQFGPRSRHGCRPQQHHGTGWHSYGALRRG